MEDHAASLAAIRRSRTLADKTTLLSVAPPAYDASWNERDGARPLHTMGTEGSWPGPLAMHASPGCD